MRYQHRSRIEVAIYAIVFATTHTGLAWCTNARSISIQGHHMKSLKRSLLSIGVLFPLAIALASPASAQSSEKARQLFDAGKYAEAKTAFVALQKADPRNPSAPYYLGRIATFDNDGDEAIRQFEIAVKLADGNALYHFWLGSALRDEAPRAGMMRQPLLLKQMKEELDRAVELDPNQLEARLELLQFEAMAPTVMGGGVEKAREQAAEITKRNAMKGAMARAFIASTEKNALAEEAAYREAIAAAPDSSAAYFALGFAYARDGKATEGFATLDQYAKRHAKDHWALYHAGRFAGTTGQQLDRGDAGLRQFLASPPSDAHVTNLANAHYWMGRIAEKRGLKEAARQQYDAALKMNPNYAAAQKALDALKSDNQT
jgi:tetratricopeptide (TPR) repeat protein